MSKKVNVKVEYEDIPIRHCAIQCPGCHRWFSRFDICVSDIAYVSDFNGFTKCKCPVCNEEFDLRDVTIDENVDFPEFYDKCAKREVRWDGGFE